MTVAYGVWAWCGLILGFSIDSRRRPYNTLALTCECVMCKARSKVTHIKQQIYFHHLKGRGYNKNSVLYPERLRWWKYIFCCFICVTLLWVLHIVIKQVFYIYNCIIVNFQLRSSINEGLTERSLYNRFCIEMSAKNVFLGDFWGRG